MNSATQTAVLFLIAQIIHKFRKGWKKRLDLVM